MGGRKNFFTLSPQHVGGAHNSLEEIADELGVTRERVRQIEEAGLKKLRKMADEEGLTLQDFLADDIDRHDATVWPKV